MEEYNLLLHVRRLIPFWWLALVAAIMGGLCGYLFSLAHRPVYEARAVFFVTIDLNRIPNPLKPLEQMDEDMALATTQAALLDSTVLQDVASQAATQSISVSPVSLTRDSVIERRGTFWDLRYHSTNPQTAQTVTNIWADRAYKAMMDMQQQGRVASYVIFNPPQQAGLPQSPIDFARTRLILAGGVIGLILGIFLSERVTSPSDAKTKS